MKVQLLSTHPHATGASWVQFSSPQNLSGASNIQNLKAMTHQADGQILKTVGAISERPWLLSVRCVSHRLSM